LARFVVRAGSDLDDRVPVFETTVTIATIAALGAVDASTGSDLAFSIFYLVPVSLAAMAGRAWLSVLSCLLATATWLVADIASGTTYSTVLIPAWTTVTRLVMFAVVAGLLGALRHALLLAEALSRTDELTQVANQREFYESAERERLRALRTGSPLSIVYIDLDNFKGVNDTAGHAAGDDVLRRVGASLRGSIRATDVVGRLGGDEFAVLLPDTDVDAAQTVAEKLHRYLRAALDADSGVDASLGVAAFRVMPGTVDELLTSADRLMYEAKNDGKGAIRASLV
jgi:diguanylate cyclase (GGDEF)-like protein